MQKEIENRVDIYNLVGSFYVKLMKDDVVGHFFEDFKNPIHLEEHLQTLVDFWDNMLFFTGAYSKNAMKPHLDLHQKKPFEKKHFERWILHFNSTVDEHFVGEIAHAAKSRALSIATVMQIKVSEQNK